MFEVQGIDHVALAVRDIETSASWYQEVLGLKRMHERVWEGLPAGVGAGETAVSLFPVQGDNPEAPPGKNVIAMRHLDFRVDRANFELAQSDLQARAIELAFQ